MASAAATWCSATALVDADGVAPRHDRPALPCDELRRAPSASRLPRRRSCFRIARSGTRATSLRGHEFHYASLTEPGSDAPLAELFDAEGQALGPSGGRRGHVTGTFFHAIARERGRLPTLPAEIGGARMSGIASLADLRASLARSARRRRRGRGRDRPAPVAPDQAAREPRAARGACRLARALAGPRGAAPRSRRGARLRRQSRRGGARRLRLSRLGHRPDGGQFRARAAPPSIRSARPSAPRSA